MKPGLSVMEHITTYMGEDFTPLAPDAKQIHIEDIAHALSLVCRANGHFIHFYSVAQHCINCANEAKERGLPVAIQAACLLHDASEAYLSDITSPVKRHLTEYLKTEKRLQNTIFEKFLGRRLFDSEAACVAQIDRDMLVCEFNALMKKRVFDVGSNVRSAPNLEFYGFLETERDFLNIFNEMSI